MKRSLAAVALIAVVAGSLYLVFPPVQGFKLRSEIRGEKRWADYLDQPRQPLPGILDFGEAGVSVLPGVK